MDPECVSKILDTENLTMISANFTYNFTQTGLRQCDEAVFPSEEFFK